MIDPTRLSAWFAAHAAPLALYARQFARDRAGDVVQEAFVALMQEPAEPRNVKAWLFRTVRNAAVSAARSERRRERRHEALAMARPAWFEPRPEDLIDASSAQACLEALPAEQREAVVLRIWADLTFAEIAELTGLRTSTVYDHYRAGLAAIRQKMEQSSCRSKTNRT